MMHQRIEADRDLWAILRTTGPRTLPLMKSLSEAGFAAWTPKRTIKRYKPGKLRENGRRPTVEIDTPILPTYVFAPAQHLPDLFAAAAAPGSPHPEFSVMQGRYGVPLVADRHIAGLREAEADALAEIVALRAAECAEEKRRVRAMLLRKEHARRKAMRAERRQFVAGEKVGVSDATAFAGMSGVIHSSNGKQAVVAFGGSLFLTVEAWQVVPLAVQAAAS